MIRIGTAGWSVPAPYRASFAAAGSQLEKYAARLTEVMLLGVVALKAGRKIEYDGANMRVTNVAAANQYLERAPRPGWSL